MFFSCPGKIYKIINPITPFPAPHPMYCKDYPFYYNHLPKAPCLFLPTFLPKLLWIDEMSTIFRFKQECIKNETLTPQQYSKALNYLSSFLPHCGVDDHHQLSKSHPFLIGGVILSGMGQAV